MQLYDFVLEKRGRHLVPLVQAVFHNDLDKLVIKVGMDNCVRNRECLGTRWAEARKVGKTVGGRFVERRQSERRPTVFRAILS